MIAVIFVICLLPGAALADSGASEVPDATPPVSPSPAAEETEDIEEPAAEAEEPSVADGVEDEELTEEISSADAQYEDAPITVSEGEVCFAAGVVFNNGGTVYNNGGVVFNNGGIVYNNLGVCYNNGGTVYNNNGVVYDNGGTVFNNGGEVVSYAADAEDAAEGENAETEDAAQDIDDANAAEDIEESIDAENADAVEESIAPEETPVPEETAEAVEENVSDDESAEVLEAPVISLLSGTYSETHEVEISAAEGALIYYTLDGSEPDTNSKLYKYHFPISKSTVIKAIAVMDGIENSETAIEEYAFVDITAPKFASVEYGYSEVAAQPITVENNSAVNAVIASVELDENGAEYFELSTNDGANVEAESIDNSTWMIRPLEKLETGMYKAIITFTFDSGDTQIVHVSMKVK